MVVVPFLSQDTFLRNVVDVTGQTPEKIIAAGAYPQEGGTFLGFMAMCSFMLFALVGFQYAAFISGEMSGGVKRTTYIASWARSRSSSSRRPFMPMSWPASSGSS